MIQREYDAKNGESIHIMIHTHERNNPASPPYRTILKENIRRVIIRTQQTCFNLPFFVLSMTMTEAVVNSYSLRTFIGQYSFNLDRIVSVFLFRYSTQIFDSNPTERRTSFLDDSANTDRFDATKNTKLYDSIRSHFPVFLAFPPS